MTKGDLEGAALWGRPVKPVAAGLTLNMLIVAQSNFRGMDRGTLPPLSWILGTAAVVAVACLIIGWVSNSQHLAEVGLLLTVGVYVARATFIMLENPWDQAIFFSLAVIVIAGGSYFLEANDRRGRRG
jgi:hypothetical protein